ncbi:MAG TPA: PH domain-containing protein [Thermoanaerobaculia bacterium]|nr:PH domain-containing protein [Thermoanaerobaculia bacterium]
MGYIERNLMPGETLLLAPRYHAVRFVPGAALVLCAIGLAAAALAIPEPTVETPLLIGGAALAVLGLAAMGWRAFVDSFDEFGVSTSRVFKKTGFLKRQVRQIPLDKVQDVNIQATLWGRWLSYGDVELQTAGTEGTVVFPRIRHPEELRNALFAHLPGAAPASVPAAARPSVEARLAELQRLKDTGVVTPEEYAERRRAILAEI